MYFTWILASLFFVISLPAAAAWDPCAASPDEAVTAVQPIKIEPFFNAVTAIKFSDSPSPIAFRNRERMRGKINTIFDPRKTTSKLSQFFRTLHLIAEHTPFPSKKKNYYLSIKEVREALVLGKMFPNKDFPNKIKSVAMRSEVSNRYKQYAFEVEYDGKSTKYPLNKGKGFGMHQHGKCQHAQALLFNDTFSFRTRRLRNGNLLTFKMNNVDIFGDFGSRGVVDVDINYVSLDRIEFFKGSNKGRVRSHVSKKEFKINKHHWLLKAISRVIPDNSVQVMDW